MKRLLGLVLPLLLVFTIVVAACDDGGGGGSDADSDDDTTIETDAPDDGDGSDGESGDNGGESAGDAGGVPNPCGLIPNSELTFLLDGEPGEGNEETPVPGQRKVCTYESGLILSVETAGNWDATLGAIRSFRPDSLPDVPGIGQAAVWQAIDGGSGQFLALSDEYFVGVTLPSGDQTVAQFIAEAMLAAL